MSSTSKSTARAVHLGNEVNGHPQRANQIVPELVRMLAAADNTETLTELARALGKAWTPEASLALLGLVDHPDAAVRLATAQALPGGAADPAVADQVADALVHLSADPVDEVRDWATFGLGSILAVDSQDVRQALFERLEDSAGDVSDEALVGLARRRDRRVLPALRERLRGDSVGALVFEAATYVADPTLQPALELWCEALPHDEDVRLAAQACDPTWQEERVECHRLLLEAVQRELSVGGFGVSAALWSARLSTDVVLGVDGTDDVWDVDNLIRRAEGNPVVAARLVLSDLQSPSV